jgi:hypothetical protein
MENLTANMSGLQGNRQMVMVDNKVRTTSHKGMKAGLGEMKSIVKKIKSQIHVSQQVI